MSDTTSELRQKIEHAVMYGKTSEIEEDITKTTDYIMQLIAAQKERWSKAARIEELNDMLSFAVEGTEQFGYIRKRIATLEGGEDDQNSI